MAPPLDFVGALIVWLRPQLAGDEKIGAKIPDGPRGKFVLVRRVGGPFSWPVIDNPMVTVETWAATHAQSHDLCRKVQALIWSRYGKTMGTVQLYNLEEVAGPTWFPDPESAEPRYMFTIMIPYKELMEVS